MTNNLLRRVGEHKNSLISGFTKKYKVHNLVFYEVYDNPEIAIEREKQLKSWNRPNKNKLIMNFNPNWVDLYESLI